MAKTGPRIKALSLNPDAKPTRIDTDRYYQMKAAILSEICGRKLAIAFSDLAPTLVTRLRGPVWRGASIKWYATTVKLDLEARGLIHRTQIRNRQYLNPGPGSR